MLRSITEIMVVYTLKQLMFLQRSVLRAVGGLPGARRRQCRSDVLGRLLRPLRVVHVCQKYLQERLQANG